MKKHVVTQPNFCPDTMTFQAESMHSDLLAGLIEFFCYCTLRLLALMSNAISVFSFTIKIGPQMGFLPFSVL